MFTGFIASMRSNKNQNFFVSTDERTTNVLRKRTWEKYEPSTRTIDRLCIVYNNGHHSFKSTGMRTNCTFNFCKNSFSYFSSLVLELSNYVLLNYRVEDSESVQIQDFQRIT